MKFSLGMRTVDRAPVGRNYADDTIANMDRAGVLTSAHFAGLVIVCSTNATAHIGQAPFLRVLTPGGENFTPNVTAMCALAFAAEVKGADWIFHLEDDLDFCSRFLESVAAWIEDEVQPTDRLITFATLKKTVDEMNGKRSFIRPVTSFHGSQCYAVRAADAPSLVEYLKANPTYRGVNQCHDLLLHGWLAQVGGDIRSSVPSFVDHIGLESKLSPGSRHVITGFPGREWEYQRASAR